MRIALNAALFLACLLAPILVRAVRMRRWGLPVRVTVDPDDPRPEAIGGYLAEIARRLDERPERMRVAFDGRNAENRAVALDLDADGALRVSVEGRRPKRIDLRGRWIADHPVPLTLRRRVLYIDPVDANRFRVALGIPFRLQTGIGLCASLTATLGLVFFVPELLSAAAGMAVGLAVCRLVRRP